jgi:hypothetical protein
MKVWRVGDETWVNLVNPEMNKVYQIIQFRSSDTYRVTLAKILISILACQFNDASNSIMELINEQKQPDPSQ